MGNGVDIFQTKIKYLSKGGIKISQVPFKIGAYIIQEILLTQFDMTLRDDSLYQSWIICKRQFMLSKFLEKLLFLAQYELRRY